MKPMISIVVVSNNKDKLDKMLLQSLRKQTDVIYEIIVIDGNDYKSASSGYNAGAEQATSDYILFVHHDIVFNSEDALSKIVQFSPLLDKEFSLLGVAGVYADEKGQKQRLMTIENGPEKKVWSHHPLMTAEEVFSVDECAFMITKI